VRGEPSAIDEVSFAEEYGECGDACYRELGVALDGTAHIIVRARRDEEILLDRTVQLPDDEARRVLELAGRAVDEPWAARYGCPDCADQGAFSLTVRNGATTQHTVLDPQGIPATFDNLVTTLRAVLAREIAN
jgi:hypothetical protein